MAGWYVRTPQESHIWKCGREICNLPLQGLYHLPYTTHRPTHPTNLSPPERNRLHENPNAYSLLNTSDMSDSPAKPTSGMNRLRFSTAIEGGAFHWLQYVMCPATPHLSRLATLLIASISLAFLAACTRTLPDGKPIDYSILFGEVGLSPGQFSYPRAIDTDGERLWIVDKAARVQVLDPHTGDSLGGWRMPAYAMGKPTGISLWRPVGGDLSTLHIFVADTHYHRIMVYVPAEAANSPPELSEPGNDGTQWGLRFKLIAQFGSYGTGLGEFTYPTDVAIMSSPDGLAIARLFVSEYGGADRVTIFEPIKGSAGYACVGSFGRFGTGTAPDPVEFNRPQSLTFDSANNELLVTDACNHRIGRFSPQGRLIAWIGSPQNAGSQAGQLKYPYGITLLPKRTVAISEFGNNRVQCIDLQTGLTLGTFGQLGRGTGQLATPWGITALGSSIFVLDSGNNRVMGFPVPKGRPDDFKREQSSGHAAKDNSQDESMSTQRGPA